MQAAFDLIAQRLGDSPTTVVQFAAKARDVYRNAESNTTIVSTPSGHGNGA